MVVVILCIQKVFDQILINELFQEMYILCIMQNIRVSNCTLEMKLNYSSLSNGIYRQRAGKILPAVHK